MNDELRKTVRIKRGEKAGTDARGRNVWTKPVEEVEFELVSTVMLKRILESDKKEHKEQIRKLADAEDGILARSTDTDNFEILQQDEFEDDGELSLVTTQALRRVLKGDDAAEDEPEPELEDAGGGYNPYDSG